MYQWDGIENNKSVMHIKDYFDKIFTFDINDSKKYGWIYRPLFYDKEMLVDIQKEIDITFMFITFSTSSSVEEIEGD